jgi:hypothetical protein
MKTVTVQRSGGEAIISVEDGGIVRSQCKHDGGDEEGIRRTLGGIGCEASAIDAALETLKTQKTATLNC